MLNISRNLESLRNYCESEGFAGWDPYDALNSPFIPFLTLGTKWGRIAWTQLLRRSPINLRPILGVPKGYNPKALGLFLSGYAKLYRASGEQDALKNCHRLLTLLEECRSLSWSGNCWGYNFPWQSRAFYLPAHTPTVVNSAFIGHALLDAFTLPGLEKAKEMALSIADFIVKDLNRFEQGDEVCFSYTPRDKYFVHNANLLGASLLIRIYEETERRELLDLALQSLRYSMNRQHADGSWFYSEWEGAHWIDSYHTGFNLEAIKYFLDRGWAKDYKEGYERGVDFYRAHFFLEDGTPKYFHDKIYPIDIHSPSQAIAFFSNIGDDSLAETVMNWMLNNMQSEDGYFYFQRNRSFTVKTPYMRWSQAWAFHALTSYHCAFGDDHER